MGSFELLSEILIETLKEFSTEKRQLTVDSLRVALSTRKALIDFLAINEHLDGPAGAPPFAASPQALPARVSLKKTESAPGPDSPIFSRMRGAYEKLLAELTPISRGEYSKGFTDLDQRMRSCNTIDELAATGDDCAAMTRLLVSRVVEEVQYANDFLAELSKDLIGMEKQLFSYQSHNRETYLLNDKFCCNILSHTEEMNKVVTNGFENSGSLLASKLTAIGKAIAMKRQEDMVRLQEADSKIAELQRSVSTYNDEIHQVTERANALEKEVLIDALTEINNRRAYDLEIYDSIKRYHRDGQPFSLILIDVDRFKNVNDLYGHRAGDKCLHEIAKRIKSSLRKADFLARYGGEELIAILHGSTAQDAKKIAEKLRNRIEQTRFCFMDEEIPVTISLGVTEARPTDTDADMPFIRVDEAMYRAKREGRNRVCMV
ncbi:MAG: GGDEF domain-containing protein [Syntrophobacteraceae bacterium]